MQYSTVQYLVGVELQLQHVPDGLDLAGRGLAAVLGRGPAHRGVTWVQTRDCMNNCIRIILAALQHIRAFWLSFLQALLTLPPAPVVTVT